MNGRHWITAGLVMLLMLTACAATSPRAKVQRDEPGVGIHPRPSQPAQPAPRGTIEIPPFVGIHPQPSKSDNLHTVTFHLRSSKRDTALITYLVIHISSGRNICHEQPFARNVAPHTTWTATCEAVPGKSVADLHVSAALEEGLTQFEGWIEVDGKRAPGTPQAPSYMRAIDAIYVQAAIF